MARSDQKELDQHRVTWLALHRQQLDRSDYHADAELLRRKRIRAAATQLPPPYDCTLAATMLLERMYIAARETLQRIVRGSRIWRFRSGFRNRPERWGHN